MTTQAEKRNCRVTVRLDPIDRIKLKNIARDQGVSAHAFAQAAIRQQIEKHYVQKA